MGMAGSCAQPMVVPTSTSLLLLCNDFGISNYVVSQTKLARLHEMLGRHKDNRGLRAQIEAQIRTLQVGVWVGASVRRVTVIVWVGTSGRGGVDDVARHGGFSCVIHTVRSVRRDLHLCYLGPMGQALGFL